MQKNIKIVIIIMLAGLLNTVSANGLLLQADTEYSDMKFKKASNLYRVVLRTEPENPRIYYMLAQCEEFLGKPKDAFKMVSRAIELDAQLTDAYVLRARLYGQNGNWVKARIDYHVALVQNPQHLMAQYGVAVSLNNLGDKEGSDAAYIKYQQMSGTQ